jgi:hypothetical protein
MAKRTKIIKVKGHYRSIPDESTGHFYTDRLGHEVYIVKMKKIYVKGYDKIVVYDDGT